MTDLFMTTKLIYIHLLEDVHQDNLKKRVKEKKNKKVNIHYMCCWMWQDNSENLKLKEFKFLFFKSALAAG